MKLMRVNDSDFEKLDGYGLENIPRDCFRHFYFEAGEDIVREREQLSWILFTISGTAKVCRMSANGKHLILCYYISEGILGEIELLMERKTAATTVRAISPFEALAVSYERCAAELKTNTVFLNKIGRTTAEKLLDSDENFMLSALCTGEQRLCTYILRNSHAGRFCDMLADVSSTIGVSYRHLGRMLRQLCADGVLERRTDGYFVKNYKALFDRSCEAETEAKEEKATIFSCQP